MVRDWIASQAFQLLEGWPGHSPDLDPIENCWIKLKECVHKHHCSSHEELIDVVKHVWTQETGVDYCHTLTESMPCRTAACLANKGGSTKY